MTTEPNSHNDQVAKSGIEKKGGYSGSSDGADMKPPAQLPSAAIQSSKPQPTAESHGE